MEEKDAFFIDELQMYFGDDYKINDYVSIHQPTIGEIIEFGEKNYYCVVSALTAIPSDMKSRLWDNGIDYSKITNYDLFCMMSRNIKKKDSEILLGDLDLSKLHVIKDSSTSLVVLVDDTGKIIIDKLAYAKIANYINKMNGITHKIENPSNETVKKMLIQIDRDNIAKANGKPYVSQLKPMISAMMRFPGFKYKKSELRECGIYEFMDTYKGAQIYIAATALLQGSYSGMIDTSKTNSEYFDWTRSE